MKTKGIAKASQEVGISEGGLRRLESKGVVHPARDPWGRRLFGADDIEAARAYLARESRPAELNRAVG